MRVAIALALVLCVPLPASAHDAKSMAAAAQGDAKRNEWFDSLKQPGSDRGCCNLHDCHQTQARQLPDGRWMAVVWDNTGVQWRLVPPEKVLRRPLSIDGEAYVCNLDGDGGGWRMPSGDPSMYGSGAKPKQYYEPREPGAILCFIPPIPGY